MNEKELVDKTIETIKRDGWVTGVMFSEDDGSHCFLGSIGKARWGEEWDLDCSDAERLVDVYVKLRRDPTARALVHRIAGMLAERNDHAQRRAQQALHRGDNPEHTDQHITWRWNDQEATAADVISVLEEIRAEIG